MRNIGERTGSKDELYRRILEDFAANLRCAMPGIIQAFDVDTQTATVQCAIREKIAQDDLGQKWIDIPLLLDVPICIPRAGGFALTLPVKQGDECLVVFADMCIDAWFSNSGVQNQIEKRRHDLSDAFAVLGVWSQPRVLPNYSADSAQLRNEAGTVHIDLKENEIDIIAPTVKINGLNVNTHTHVAPYGGGQTSGPG